MSPLDFGAAPPRRLSPWAASLAVMLVTGLTVAAMTPRLLKDRADAIAQSEAWTIDGPPCPELSPARAAASPYQPAKRFGYAGANFGYVFGHVVCAQIHDDGGRSMFRGYPVCQFTSPAIVAVDMGGKTAFFTPGLGRRVTVSVQEGSARCVMAGRFHGQNDF